MLSVRGAVSSVQHLGAGQGGRVHAEGAGMGAGRWRKQELMKVLHLRIRMFCPSILSLTSPAPNMHTYPPGDGPAPAGTVGYSHPFTCVPSLLPECLCLQSPCRTRIEPASNSCSKVNVWIGRVLPCPLSCPLPARHFNFWEPAASLCGTCVTLARGRHKK